MDTTLGDWVLLKTLGYGHYSKVKLGYNPVNKQYSAVKIIKHSHPDLDLKDINREIDILTKLKHPNIINLIEFHESIDYIKKDGRSYKCVAIVTELAEGGELFNYIAESGRFSEEVARTYFRILIETLEYCHEAGYAHRDLKPENLLFDANFNLKIADFGYATLLCGQDNSGLLQTNLGTPCYMAPEIHANKKYNGASVDLFASGVILFILVSGTGPFIKATPKDTYYNYFCNKNDAFWTLHERNKPKQEGKNFYSAEFRELINSMLAHDPACRPTIAEIKASKWYNGDAPQLEDIQAEFNERKKRVDEELLRQQKLKEQQKLIARMQAANTNIPASYKGIKPLRSLELELEESLMKKIQDKVDCNAKREIRDYIPQSGQNCFTVLNPDFIFKYICTLSPLCFDEYTASSKSYKIKCNAQRDEGNCSFVIEITRVDDNSSCIEFYKRSGNFLAFHKVVQAIKSKLPSLESDNEKKVQ